MPAPAQYALSSSISQRAPRSHIAGYGADRLHAHLGRETIDPPADMVNLLPMARAMACILGRTKTLLANGRIAVSVRLRVRAPGSVCVP